MRGRSSNLPERDAFRRIKAMPIYEFYCDDCNTIFNFFSRSINTGKIPACPKCKKPGLERRISLFAVTGKSSKKGDGDAEGTGNSADMMDKLPFDEKKMEKAMETLAGEAEKVDEKDPRAAANLMRKLSDMTGLKYGSKMEEAINRMESGEDPESIEAEMGDVLEHEDPFVLPDQGDLSKQGKAKKQAPRRDETLYEM
jgi:putative FmdB family regulatory protein